MKYILDSALKLQHRLIWQVSLPIEADAVMRNWLYERNAAEPQMRQASDELIEMLEIGVVALTLQGGYGWNGQMDMSRIVSLHERPHMNFIWLSFGQRENAIRVERILFHRRHVAA